MAKKKGSHNNTTQKVQGWSVREPVLRPDLANEPNRVNLDPTKFDNLIKRHGVKVHIFRSMYCPNVKSIDGGEHNIDCTLCNGSGFLDTRPITMDVFIQNQTLDQLHAVEGMHDGNTVMMSFPIGIELQYFTLIELCDHSEIFFQRIARSDGDLDRLKYKALRVNILIDQDGVEYFEGSDFKLNSNGDILWLQGKGPYTDTIYSIHYESRIQFRAIKAMHTNRFEQVKLSDGNIAQVKFPEQWMCTKEFLVRRQGTNGEDLLPNKIPHYEEETPEE